MDPQSPTPKRQSCLFRNEELQLCLGVAKPFLCCKPWPCTTRSPLSQHPWWPQSMITAGLLSAAGDHCFNINMPTRTESVVDSKLATTAVTAEHCQHCLSRIWELLLQLGEALQQMHCKISGHPADRRGMQVYQLKLRARKTSPGCAAICAVFYHHHWPTWLAHPDIIQTWPHHFLSKQGSLRRTVWKTSCPLPFPSPKERVE